MAGYDYQKIIEKIQKFEDNYPVETLCFMGINFWPLIKSDINFQMLNKEYPDKESDTEKNFKQKIGDIILSFKNWRAALRNFSKIEKTNFDIKKKKVLYISYSSFRNQLLNNKYYNALSDSFADSMRNREDLAIIEFKSHGVNNKPAFENIIEGDQLILQANLNRKKQHFFQYCKAIFNNKNFNHGGFPYKEFSLFVEKNETEFKFSKGDFFYNAEYVIQLKNIFVKLVKGSTIQYVITPIYYNLESFAIILACKELNIKCLEIQHGVYSRSMYHFPEKKHDLLPDFFFSWDKEQASFINQWNSVYKYHRAFDYGNNTISFWQKHKDNFNNKYLNNAIDTIKNKPNYIHVLYSVAEFFEENLSELIIASKSSIYWHIRKHPRTKYNDEDSFIKKLEKHDCQNYNIENASFSPLYSLLEEMDYHITPYSSTVCEAVLLDVPTVVTDKSGTYLFKETYKGNKLIYFSEKNEEILNFISQKRNRKEIKNYSTPCFEDFIATIPK